MENLIITITTTTTTTTKTTFIAIGDSFPGPKIIIMFINKYELYCGAGRECVQQYRSVVGRRECATPVWRATKICTDESFTNSS